MLDIMRYQFRTMLRKSVVHILNICLLGTGTLMMFFDSFNAEEGEPILKATEYMPKTLPTLMALAMFGATCLTTMVAGDDFSAGPFRQGNLHGLVVEVGGHDARIKIDGGDAQKGDVDAEAADHAAQVISPTNPLSVGL